MPGKNGKKAEEKKNQPVKTKEAPPKAENTDAAPPEVIEVPLEDTLPAPKTEEEAPPPELPPSVLSLNADELLKQSKHIGFWTKLFLGWRDPSNVLYIDNRKREFQTRYFKKLPAELETVPIRQFRNMDLRWVEIKKDGSLVPFETAEYLGTVTPKKAYIAVRMEIFAKLYVTSNLFWQKLGTIGLWVAIGLLVFTIWMMSQPQPGR